MAPARRRQNSVRRQLRFHHAPRARPAQPRSRRRLHRIAERGARFLQKLAHPQPRLRHNLHRAVFQRLERALRPLLRQARTNHHRDRMLRHDPAQKRQPVHARHLDVQRDHVRHLLGDLLRRRIRIARGPDHLDLRILRQHVRQRLAHHCGIVHNQHANLRIIHPSASRSTVSCAPLRSITQQPEPHFPGRCIEIDVEPARPTQARRGYIESLRAQHLQRPSRGSAGPPSDATPLLRPQHIRATEQLDLDVPPPALPGRRTAPPDRESQSPHSAAPRRRSAFLALRLRLPGQHRVAQRGNPQLSMPEGHPHARSQQRVQNRRPAHQVRFSRLHIDLRQFLSMRPSTLLYSAGPSASSGRFMSCSVSEWPTNRYPPGTRRLRKLPQNLLLRRPVEIDDHVAAEDRVRLFAQSVIGVHEIQPPELHQPAQFRHHPHPIRIRARGCASDISSAAPAAPAPHPRSCRRPAPPWPAPSSKCPSPGSKPESRMRLRIFAQHHRQRVRLFARRTPGAPHQQRPPVGPRRQFRQRSLRQIIEVLRLAKEIRLVRRDHIDETRLSPPAGPSCPNR